MDSNIHTHPKIAILDRQEGFWNGLGRSLAGIYVPEA